MDTGNHGACKCGYLPAYCKCAEYGRAQSPAPTSTVAPDTGAAASGVMGPVVTPDLLSCPFCGGEASQPHGDQTVYCGTEDCAAFDIQATVTQWNRRAYRSAPASTPGAEATPQGETCAVCGGSGTYADPDEGCWMVCKCSGECRSTTRDRE